MEGGAWWATVHGVAKSRTQLSDFTFTFTFLVAKFFAIFLLFYIIDIFFFDGSLNPMNSFCKQLRQGFSNFSAH